ncbi:MAG: glycine zipper family protein [Candidatus Brocadiia bacterium]|jgi:hypothetical protein|nr:glycine zipper family protein [Candidatus Brocadiia bacterium]
MMRWKMSLVLAVVLVAASGCARYERKPLAFRMPSEHADSAELDGVVFGARVIDDRREAKEAFGFDIIKAGILPVQVVTANNGYAAFEIVAAQTFLVDTAGRHGDVLDQVVAHERISEKTGWGEVAPGAGKGALVGTSIGAVGGLAVGVLTDTHTGEAVLGGAAIGAAGGALVGGAKGLWWDRQRVDTDIMLDLHARSLANKRIEPGQLGHGLILYGTEAGRAAKLKLSARNTETWAVHMLELSRIDLSGP